MIKVIFGGQIFIPVYM